MTLVAHADQGQLLNAVWCAHLAMAPHTVSVKVAKRGASVGHAILQARYYDGSRGQFLSEDPSFLAVGTSKLTEIMTRADGKKQDDSKALKLFLSDPQMMNSYSYARNNPLVNKDPTGEWGVFVTGTVGGDFGLAEGFAGSLQSGVGFTTSGNPFSSPVEAGAYSSYGGLVGGPLQSITVEGAKGIKDSNYAVFGLGGGVSRGITFTNATKISQLQGTDVSRNIGIGLMSVSWSSSNGIWAFNVSFGPKPAVSYSQYPVTTQTNTTATAANGSIMWGSVVGGFNPFLPKK
jgi:hypothetical protein